MPKQRSLAYEQRSGRQNIPRMYPTPGLMKSGTRSRRSVRSMPVSPQNILSTVAQWILALINKLDSKQRQAAKADEAAVEADLAAGHTGESRPRER